MKIYRINTFLSTLNFVLLFVGYQLATTLFLPTSSDIEGISRTVTVPYRVFALLISLVVILLNFKRQVKNKSLGYYVLLFYWFVLIIRMVYDIYLNPDFYVKEPFQLWIYVFGMCLPALFSVIKSIDYIDFVKALKWVIGLTIVTIILTLFSNQNMFANAEDVINRQEGNLAFNSISYGHLGTMGIFLALFYYLQYKPGKVLKILLVIFIILSFFTMLRAGSRSPVVALFIVLLFWLFSKGKNLIIGTLSLAVLGLLLIALIDPILNFMGSISPFLENRFRAAIYEGESSGRSLLYVEAFQNFSSHPFFGKSFAFQSGYGSFMYSHNIVLDAFMGIGIIGGIAIITILVSALKKSYKLLNVNVQHAWFSLVLIQQIVLSMFSGAFYYNNLLSALLALTFLFPVIKLKNTV